MSKRGWDLVASKTCFMELLSTAQKSMKMSRDKVLLLPLQFQSLISNDKWAKIFYNQQSLLAPIQSVPSLNYGFQMNHTKIVELLFAYFISIIQITKILSKICSQPRKNKLC